MNIYKQEIFKLFIFKENLNVKFRNEFRVNYIKYSDKKNLHFQNILKEL